MRHSFAGGRRATLLSALVAVLAATALFAPSAGAVLVHVGHGQVAGVTPRHGVNPAAIPGSFAHHSRGRMGLADSGLLNYHGGAVLHGVAPYVIFWDPASKIPAADKALYTRFLADSAAQSGTATNVYSVDRQFTDGTGFANYDQTFTAAQSITDSQPYPTTGQCTETSFPETACLFDSQLQTETARLIAANGLPKGIAGHAPFYLIVTPPDVNTCFSDGTTCADNFYCAYHSSFTDGSSTVLYSSIAEVLDANQPKGCQADGNSAVQAPNANPIVDVSLKAFSHEFNETITDPVNGGGWYATNTGQENGDECNFTGALDPGNDSNPNAFLPTLGGSAAAGTLFNQSMNGNPYYVQSEWSNGDLTCQMKSKPSALTPAFTAPATASSGSPVSFDPAPSSSAAGFTSTTWNFGDGAQAFNRGAPAIVSHAFATDGVHTVTLTEVDTNGNLATFNRTIDVGVSPTAAFAVPTAHLVVGSPVSFDGSASTAPAGTSISSYTWDFGDGSAGSGAMTAHTYGAPGTYTVKLTATDGSGATSTTSHVVTVTSLPSAAINVTTPHPTAGSPVSFSGAASQDPGGSITSYTWNFGDGSTGTGAAPAHTYATAGTYTVKLSIVDNFGSTGTQSATVTVVGAPRAVIATISGKTIAAVARSFNGSQSSDVGSSIVSYSWSFGDGGTATGASPSHTYKKAGKYTVTLTVTDASGATAGATASVTVKSPSISRVSVKKGQKVELIKVKLSGPGTLTAGSKKFRVTRARTITVHLKLSQAQRSKLHRQHKLTVRLKLKFAPKTGKTVHKTVTIKLKG